MTKTLTEQWREGTLKGGIYYLLLRDGTTVTDETVYIVGEKQLRWRYSSFDFVKEVLAPMPSYDKVKEMSQKIERLEFDNEALEISRDELKKKLDIATNALNGIRDVWANNPNEFSYIARIANRKAKTALEKMEGVK